MRSRFKKNLINLKRSRAGVYRKDSCGLYLDRNERVVPYDRGVMRLLCERLSRIQLNLYPDVDIFYDRLANWLGVKSSEIFVTEGVSGAVKSIVETIANAGDNIIFPAPTFAMYPVYCDMFDLEYRTFGYKDDYSMDVDSMMSLMDNKTSIIFLPNPNVPIEGTLDIDTINDITDRCRKNKTFLIMDEVYYPFGGPTAEQLLTKFDNLLIMRSFSKAFGLAGIRVGYILGNEDNISYISKTRTGYESDSVSMDIASFFMDNYELVEKYIVSVKDGLSYLKAELDKLGLEHNGGEVSNFIFINLHSCKKACTVVDELKERGVFIRGNWPKPFDGGFSVTAGPVAVIKKFVNELSGVLNNI